MEMGGASLQIAFQPEGSILADKFPVKVGGQIYPLYVHSYLNYGQNYADLWVKQYLYDEGEEKNNIHNPCMLSGTCRNFAGHNLQQRNGLGLAQKAM